MRIFVVIPGVADKDGLYNRAVNSVLSQGITPDGVVAVLDGRANDRRAVIKNIPLKRFLITCLSNESSMGAAANIWAGIEALHARDEDIICLLDGDDWLRPTALFTVLQTYLRNQRIWLTYGSYECQSGRRSKFVGPYRKGETFRMASWKASHLKTFRYGLWKHLPESALKDCNGKWLDVCSDLAIMFPLMEMAGHDRIKHISENIYVYNDQNPLSDHRIKGQRQLEIDRWLRLQFSYKRLESI